MLKRASAAAVTAALITLSLAGCAPTGSSPEDVLDDYLTAISEGRATDALKLVEHANQGEARLLTDDVLAAAESRISDIQVGKDAAPEGTTYEVDEKGGSIPYSYSLAGEVFYGSAPLFKSDDGSWKVDGLPGDGSVLGTVSLSATPSELVSGASVAGVDVPVGEAELVFPAVYTTEFTPADGFEAVDSQPVRVTGDDALSVAADVTPGDDLVASAASTAQEFVAGCATSTSDSPEVGGIACPFFTSGMEQVWENARSLTTGWTGIAEVTPESCTADTRNDRPVAICDYSAPSAVFTLAPDAAGILAVGEVSRASDGDVKFRPIIVDLLSLSVVGDAE